MLLLFFRRGYLYKEVRWQHVGCRLKEDGKLELALLDLDSLSDLQSLKKLEATELKKEDPPFLWAEFLKNPDPSVSSETLIDRINGDAVIKWQIGLLKKK